MHSKSGGLRALAGAAILALSALGACSAEEPELPPLRPDPTRGYIVISLDTLRADRLGFHGYDRDTSPFLDAVAERATVFDNAIVQLPGTLPSHMSIFTGLYPAEHGVYPPDSVLSDAIMTVPMRFRLDGHATAGFTEGGFAAGHFGFDRGFQYFSDDVVGGARDFERTLAKGLDFLRSLESSQPFFLFLHTYAIHDPYDPPEPYRSMFWDGEPPDVFEPTGTNLVSVNHGERQLTEQGLRYFEALYDGGIRYADDRLAEFWQAVEELGLAEQTTLVVTSDHGEEFLEHGKLVHEQAYLESLHVPLLIAHPRIGKGRRVQSLVESVDIAPTLYELAGFDEQPQTSGESLVKYLFGDPEPAHSDAYAEEFVSPKRTLLWREDGFHQVVFTPLRSEAGGYWAMPSITFDWPRPELSIDVRGFRKPRQVRVSADGQALGRYDIAPTRTRLRVALPEGDRHDVTIRGEDCDSPNSLGINEDTRCMSFFVYSRNLTHTELYDLVGDPGATTDIGRERRELEDRLIDELTSRRFDARGGFGRVPLDDELVRRLRALGYLR